MIKSLVASGTLVLSLSTPEVQAQIQQPPPLRCGDYVFCSYSEGMPSSHGSSTVLQAVTTCTVNQCDNRFWLRNRNTGEVHFNVRGIEALLFYHDDTDHGEYVALEPIASPQAQYRITRYMDDGTRVWQQSTSLIPRSYLPDILQALRQQGYQQIGE